MSAAFGVHFGSTSASIAVCKDGKTDVIANDGGDRTTPAIVAFTDHEKQVGLSAKQGLTRNAANSVCNAKNMLGVAFEEPCIQAAIKGPVKVLEKNGLPVYQVSYLEKEVTFSPKDIATFVYKKMMETAVSNEGNAECHDAVISVPVDFNKQQRKEICSAATAAGFNVLRMITEPSAAVLAYGFGQNDVNEQSTAVVYRLGGTSLSVSVLSVSNGMYRILANITDHELGGHLINESMVKHFAEEFQRKWKMDCLENKRSVAKLRNGAENCKHVLSVMQEATISVDSLYEGVDFQGKLSRGRFEALCGSFVQQCLQPLKGVLEQAGVTKDDISKLIVCGGTTKIPLLQKQLAAYFPQAELLNRNAPDEVIAIGCAIEASMLSSCDAEPEDLLRNETNTEVPCIGSNILVKLGGSDSQFHKVLSCYTPFPVRRVHKFQLGPDQTSFCLRVYSSPESNSSEPQLVAKIVMTELPAGVQVTGTFHVRLEGSLHITCSEASSNKTESLTIESS